MCYVVDLIATVMFIVLCSVINLKAMMMVCDCDCDNLLGIWILQMDSSSSQNEMKIKEMMMKFMETRGF